MKQELTFRVFENKCCTPSSHLITLVAKEALPDTLPGQFVEVKIPNSPNTFLRRPFSIFNVAQHTLQLFVKTLGEGSRVLNEVQEGDELNLIIPLGKGFTLPQPTDRILLVGGGVGIAPIYYLADYLSVRNFDTKVDVLIGFINEKEVTFNKSLAKIAELHITTDDGSVGEQGRVTDHSICSSLESFDRIYVCGPHPMMHAVANLAKTHNIPCEVSLENTMACGFGVCLCCVTNTTTGNRCVCTDGPVFSSEELVWSAHSS